MQPDSVLTLGKSQVQHGPANDRVYLMKLDDSDMPGIVGQMERLARENGYSKLFAKVPSESVAWFAANGFINEARVPRMCMGDAAGCFMSKYLTVERAVPTQAKTIAEVLELAKKKSNVLGQEVDASAVVPLGPDDAEEMARLYDDVFESYPFPITDPGFLRSAMNDNVDFFGFRQDGRLIAVASAEVDEKWQCAEMTDFATLPECRGKGVAGKLLHRMEIAMQDRGIFTAFTIARAESPGMNSVFSKAGYNHAGTLHNNTQIGGKLESMNVWYKPLHSG